jgi:hypothetical protein
VRALVGIRAERPARLESPRARAQAADFRGALPRRPRRTGAP